MTYNETEFCGGRKVAVMALTGSHNYNLNTPASDKDFKLFVWPTFDDLYTGRMFSNSMVSDTMDATCHDVRQLVELVWKANLNFIEILYSIELVGSGDLRFFFDHDDALSKMNLWTFYKATCGMHQMKMKDLNKGTGNTTQLVEKFGYDTKQACHALRCLLVLERFARWNDMGKALWFADDDTDREVLLNVKAGKYSEADFRAMVEHWHDTRSVRVERFYKDTEPNEALYNEMKENMKQAVQEHLF